MQTDYWEFYALHWEKKMFHHWEYSDYIREKRPAFGSTNKALIQ